MKFLESITLEKKRNLDQKSTLQKVINTMKAFSNSFGGSIYIGIADDDSVIGINETSIDDYKNKIDNSISDLKLITKLKYNYKIEKIENKIILIINVHPNEFIIYEDVHNNKDRGEYLSIYIRIESQTRKIKNEIATNYIINRIKNNIAHKYLLKNFKVVGDLKWFINDEEKYIKVINNLIKSRMFYNTNKPHMLFKLDEKISIYPIVNDVVYCSNNIPFFRVDWYIYEINLNTKNILIDFDNIERNIYICSHSIRMFSDFKFFIDLKFVDDKLLYKSTSFNINNSINKIKIKESFDNLSIIENYLIKLLNKLHLSVLKIFEDNNKWENYINEIFK